jgi:ATP-dependent Clp protease ATP-binding subunit ClpA
VPKINVYLPDDLAAAVRAAGIPVSPVCQQALAEAVRSVAGVRRAIELIRSPGFDPAGHPDIQERMDGRMTARLTEIFSLARGAGGGEAGTGHLLTAVLDQGDNLGLLLLEAIDIGPDEAREAIARAGAAGPGREGAEPGGGAGGLTRAAWRVLASAAEASIDMGNNYLGSEHLILGLLAEDDSAGGRALRGLGGDPARARRILASMLSAYRHGREKTLPTGAGVLGEVMRRLDALETQVAALGAAGSNA